LTDTFPITHSQFGKLLEDALKPSGGVHWETVLPVFVSAFLAMCVGIALEYFKNHRDTQRSEDNKQKQELTENVLAAFSPKGKHSKCLPCTAPGSLDKRLAYAARLKGWSCQAARASSGLRWRFFSISHLAL
jgi:hypothetical protein